jgi:hypothetical protein
MRVPSFKRLLAETKRNGYHSAFSGVFLHPNPKYYKYYWWVFWKDSPCDGEQFLSQSNRLSSKQAFDLIDKLKTIGHSHWVYNRRLPRLDSDNPFDVNAEKWRDIEWALAFDQDTDEEINGIK